MEFGVVRVCGDAVGEVVLMRTWGSKIIVLLVMVCNSAYNSRE